MVLLLAWLKPMQTLLHPLWNLRSRAVGLLATLAGDTQGLALRRGFNRSAAATG